MLPLVLALTAPLATGQRRLALGTKAKGLILVDPEGLVEVKRFEVAGGTVEWDWTLEGSAAHDRASTRRWAASWCSGCV